MKAGMKNILLGNWPWICLNESTNLDPAEEVFHAYMDVKKVFGVAIRIAAFSRSSSIFSPLFQKFDSASHHGTSGGNRAPGAGR